MERDYLSVDDLSRDELTFLLDLSGKVKAHPGDHAASMSGRSVVMIFEKPSTRTRVSFEVAIASAGGHPVPLSSAELQLGRGETIEDTGRVLSRYAHAIVLRTFEQERLELLAGAGMLTGLQKFSGSVVRQRGSSPKLLVLNTALVSATSGQTLREARRDPNLWGRLIETAVGAHLVNTAEGSEVEVSYWRERNREVDFVLRRGRRLTAIEVTSGRRKGSLPGLSAFKATFAPTRTLLVGGQGLPLEEFLGRPAAAWLR